MVSEEGLNAYGAVTWGQFFIYQGFNEKAGWMHTSGGGDEIDEYLETVVEKERQVLLQVRRRERRCARSQIALPYKTASGMASRRRSPPTSRTTARSCASRTASGWRSS